MGNVCAQDKEIDENHEDNFASSEANDSGEIVETATASKTKMTTPGPRVSEIESSVGDSDFIEDNLKYTSLADRTIQDGRQTLKDRNAVLFQEIILRGGKDESAPKYTGISCLADGRVVIADYIHSICCLYDSVYNYMSSYTMSSNPWNVCTIDTDEVAVALPDEKKIQFLKIGDTIHPSGLITTRRKCLSLVALNKRELVYTGTEKNENTYYFGTITKDGREKSCFHFPRGNITYSDVYIALNSCKTRLYISCFDVGTVYCFGLDGMQYFEYKVQEGPNQGKPYGIALDRDNTLYVVVRNLHSIHRLSTECQLQQIIKNMIPKLPIAICFRHSGDSFLLTSDCIKTKIICYSFKLK